MAGRKGVIMNLSDIARANRVGGVVLAGLVLASTSVGAQAYGDYGVLRLQLGATNQFLYVDDPTSPSTTYVQGFGESKKGCLLKWATGSTNKALATLTPGGGAGEVVPGFGPTSIGVYDGAQGVACYRVSADAFESLTFGLGSFTTGDIGANAYDRIELDLEVKKDAKIILTTYIAGSISRVYELRSGGSIVAGDGLFPAADGSWPEADPANRVVNCSARSDSGPDSGPSDNCRWIINDLGQTFKIEAAVGEFSLEGGGDWGADADDNNSIIHLTWVVEGDLICGGTTPTIDVGAGEGGSCVVAGPPRPESGTCTTVSYVLRSFDDTQQGCEFIKAPGQYVASMTITFPYEPRTELDSVPPTTVEFSDGAGGLVAYTPVPFCTGTVGGTADNPTIEEVLTGTTRPPGYVDVIPETPIVDWACILEQTVEHMGPLSDPQMQVTQRVLFWGDFRAARGEL